MSLRRCPVCGQEYLDWVQTCSDCAVALGPPEPSLLDEPGDDHLVYELGEWSPAQRDQLDRLLDEHDVVHAWEATDLVVREGDEQVVDRLLPGIDPDLAVEEVEPEPEPGSRGVERSAAADGEPADAGFESVHDLGDLTDGEPTDDGFELVYDLGDLTDGERGELVARLAGAGVPHDWDDADSLVVDAVDEAVVEQILDDVVHPDALPVVADAEGGDGADDEAGPELLSELFLAADRLRNDPEDHEGVLGMVDAAAESAGHGPPFGVPERTWAAVVERAGALRAALETDDVDDEAIVAAADELRSLLRPLV
ncbi:MAG: hypothetical protein IPM45_06665 [Acidimicrobiales bacterium]|nr:hypothetical protein [Acidimicrobiales bacterium]